MKLYIRCSFERDLPNGLQQLAYGTGNSLSTIRRRLLHDESRSNKVGISGFQCTGDSPLEPQSKQPRQETQA